MNIETSLYFHIPFCKHRCAYCDFNTYAGREALIPVYVEALCRETAYVANSHRTTNGYGRGVKQNLITESEEGIDETSDKMVVYTIFFGGGTPSLVMPKHYELIFQAVRDHFSLSNPEISLEANPGTVTRSSLGELHQIGFNRISFGAQSMVADELKMLERIHDTRDVIDSVEWARQAGFQNINLDLIYGLPGQSLESWQESLVQVMKLEPEHLSLYALTIEAGTRFGQWVKQGVLAHPDPDLAAEMYEWGGEYLEVHGYRQYEISNWAKEGSECQHNLQTWRNLPYLGIGAGAHGCAGGMRVANAKRIKSYVERMTPPFEMMAFPYTPATIQHHRLTKRVEMQETMMLGLRLVEEGVTEARFRKRFGLGICEAFEKEVAELVRLGLVVWDGQRLRLSRRGRLVANQVFIRFVD